MTEAIKQDPVAYIRDAIFSLENSIEKNVKGIKDNLRCLVYRLDSEPLNISDEINLLFERKEQADECLKELHELQIQKDTLTKIYTAVNE